MFPSGEGFVRFYDFQAASLLDGHWDVPGEALAGEAFSHAGRQYGYFGFAPSLPRMLLNYLFPARFGEWSRISMIMGMLSLIFAFLMLIQRLKMPPPLTPFLMLVVLGGSTAMFLSTAYLIFHEAIMWGASLAIWSYLWFARYLETPRFRYLAYAAIFGFGAFFSRMSSGAGILACASLLAVCLLVQAPRRGSTPLQRIVSWMNLPRPRRPALHASFLVVYVIAMVSGFISINYAKFGTYLDQAPVRYHVQYTPARIERIHGKLVHPELIPFNAANYFDPRHIKLKSAPPFLGLTMETEKSAAQLDVLEPYAAFPVAMPALFALSVAACLWPFQGADGTYRRYVVILGPALLAGLALLAVAAISYRYQHDWYPFFFFGAALGAVRVAQMPSGPRRMAAIVGLSLAGLWSIVANIGFIDDLRHSGLFGW
jgi:hypothetical protein